VDVDDKTSVEDHFECEGVFGPFSALRVLLLQVPIRVFARSVKHTLNHHQDHEDEEQEDL